MTRDMVVRNKEVESLIQILRSPSADDVDLALALVDQINYYKLSYGTLLSLTQALLDSEYKWNPRNDWAAYGRHRLENTDQRVLRLQSLQRNLEEFWRWLKYRTGAILRRMQKIRKAKKLRKKAERVAATYGWHELIPKGKFPEPKEKRTKIMSREAIKIYRDAKDNPKRRKRKRA